jgi:hypothetical protein
MEIARMLPGLARAVASLLTLNRGFAPVVMAGLGPPSRSSFARPSQDVDGRPSVSSRAGRPTAGVDS